MKTFALFLALCLPACAQFNFYHALSTWKGTNPPFTPASITGLAVWGDATQEVGYVNNDFISSASDFSGNGRVATQASSSKQPIYKTNVIGAKASFYFDGFDNFFQLPASYYPFNSDYTLALVVTPSTLSGLTQAIVTQGVVGRPLALDINSTNYFIDYSTTLLTTYAYSSSAASSSTPYYIIITKSGSTLTMYKNGIAGTTVGSTFDTNSTDRVALGIDVDLVSLPFYGYISEWCIWPSAVSGGDLTNLQTYLLGKATP